MQFSCENRRQTEVLLCRYAQRRVKGAGRWHDIDVRQAGLAKYGFKLPRHQLKSNVQTIKLVGHLEEKQKWNKRMTSVPACPNPTGKMQQRSEEVSSNRGRHAGKVWGRSMLLHHQA